MFTAPTVLPDDPATLQLILHAALAEIERLRLLIAGLERNRFGRRSERLDDAAFQQGAEDLEQSLAEQVARVPSLYLIPVGYLRKPAVAKAGDRTTVVLRGRQPALAWAGTSGRCVCL